MLIPPMARWIDTMITLSSEKHRFREDRLDESLDSLEINLKERNLAGVSLAFQGEIITLWVHGNKIGKLKQTDEDVNKEQRDILFALSVVALIAILC